MLKKAFRVTFAFGLFVAGYAAYAQVFALVARKYQTAGPHWTKHTEPETAVKAKKLAERAKGKDHWSADKDLEIRIYNSERKFWMYAPTYKRLEGGKVLEFAACLIISESNDGKSLKTIESNNARVELDRAFGVVPQPGDPPSGSMKVIRARLEGDIVIRDDKGTENPADDMRITKLTHLDYEDASLTITSSSDVDCLDDKSHVTGNGLLIKLRPNDAVPGVAGSSGFNGVQTLILKKDVHVELFDVGASGILPGTTASAPTPPEPAKTAAKTPPAPTPLDVRSTGLMQVDLPKPPPPVAVGPPTPQGPTLVHFERNVEVLRRRSRPAARFAHLRQSLSHARPRRQASQARRRDEADNRDRERERRQKRRQAQRCPRAGQRRGRSLTLRRAVANGHNVHLVSPAQGIKASCNELIHTKFLRPAPDQTYLRGDATTRLIVEKEDIATDGPNKGKVVGYTLIHTIDATIFDDGTGNDNATIVARGPGDLEAHRARDQPLERTARWEDQLTMLSVPPRTVKPGQPPQLRKRLTLTGQPGFNDLLSKSTLNAKDVLVVWLAPKAAPAPVANAAKPDPGVKKSGGLDIDELVALGDVQLTSPGKTLTARDRLDAVFESPIPTVVVDDPNRPAPVVSAPANANANANGKPGDKPAEKPAERPEEPEARAIADRIWAKVLLKPTDPAKAKTQPAPASGGLLGGGSGGSQAEVDVVFLRGGVRIHQDPEVGKKRGTDIKGEAVDVYKTGENTSRFIVFERIPPEPGKLEAPAPAAAPPRPCWTRSRRPSPTRSACKIRSASSRASTPKI